MPLSPGSRIGGYEVLDALGAGGMGEVYRARDTRLNRFVAIKVLPDAFGADAERLARFTREAQTLASLNHPNIASIYGVEANAIVMELVDGEDLSTLIAKSADPSRDFTLGLDQILRIAHQIIDALEAAHDLGIVHRDLKPANIKVRDDGSVKVLDFGLAKTLEADSPTSNTANSPTLTARATAMGVILGTASYMSPEQARGRAVDKRTDVWAFGCVLYELLSGRKAFDGEDATEIISSVVKTEPDWSALPSSVPAHVRTVITRCLVKERKARIPDLSVVRYWLDERNLPAASAVPVSAERSPARLWQAAAGVLLLTTAAAGVAWYRARTTTPQPVTRFHILSPEGGEFSGGNRAGTAVAAISPDGRTVAFSAQNASGQRMIYLRRIDSLAAVPLAGTENGGYPFWSPDGRFIAFTVTGQLKKIAIAGGPPTVLCALNAGIFSRGGSWNADDVLVFNNGPGPLYRVPAAGGEATKIGSLKPGESGRQFPWFLPDRRHFLYHASGTSDQVVGIWVGSLDPAEEPRHVMPSATGAVYDQRTGRLLFTQQGTLLAQPFDLATFTLSGEPVPIGERVEASVVPGVVSFSISTNGVLAFGTGETAAAQTQMTWVDRKGAVIGTIGPPATYRGISLSPDGLQIAAHRHEGDGGDIWITNIKRNSTTRLTFDAAQENSSPVWSPESDRVAYASMRGGKRGIYVRNADGTGQEAQLFEGFPVFPALPFSWSRTGSVVLFMMPGENTGPDLWTVSLAADHRTATILQSAFSESHAQFSPDGKWLAYTSTESGTPEVYVKPAFSDGGKWNVSSGPANAARWRGDSRELYYFSNGKITAVPITPNGAAIEPGTPVALFDYAGQANLGHPTLFSYAVANDGQKFLISGAREAGPVAERSIVVVLNWDEGMRKR